MSSYEKIINQLIERAVTNGFEELDVVERELITKEEVTEDTLSYFYRSLETKYECLIRYKHCDIDELDIWHEKWDEVVRLIGWCIRRLEDWPHVDLISINEITVILNVTCFLDKEGCFWRSLKMQEIPLSMSLINHSKHELSRLRSEFKIDDTLKVPTYEREALDRFLTAISNKSWQDIFELWRMFNNRPLLTLENIQRLYILDYFEPSLLVSAFNDTRDIPILMHIMFYLRAETAFVIGFETHNDFLEFASVYSTLNTPNGKKVLTDGENIVLTSIFNKIRVDDKKFMDWMCIFNRYPQRYPNIQIALGKMLATTDTVKNIEVYVKSISLNNHTSNESRAIVSACLIEFTKSSCSIRRKELWHIAYKHWAEWNFGGINDDNYISKVSFTDLDIAIVGYYKECLSNDERLSVKKDLEQNMQLFQNRWHYSPSAATTFWYLNLSLFQVVEHSIMASEDVETWLLSGRYYVPNQFYDNKYSAMLTH